MSDGLAPLRFVKNWNRGTDTREENWDELARKTAAFGLQTNNNLKQIALDIGGPTYGFNGVGRGTQSINLISRIDSLEDTSGVIGAANIGLDTSVVSVCEIVSADGTDLSATNKGIVTFNSSTTAGQIVRRDITANLSVALTGAHWGNDTYGDLTDYVLWIVMFDNGSDCVLGVTAQGGRQYIPSTDTSITPANIVSVEDVLVSSAISSNYNVTYVGWFKADFDDSGNAGGENFWTIQSGIGDVNFQATPSLYEGTVLW